MKALVLSGGGSHGAYQVGVLKALVRANMRTDYDIITGVSVGALNGAFLAQYPAGKFIQATEDLEYLWRGLNTKKIYKQWCPPYISALWKTSVFDSSPLQDIVRKGLNAARVRASGKQLRIGAVGLSSGHYTVFDQNYIDLPGAVIASSAFPAFLVPPSLEGQLWTDGGVKNITPLGEAIAAGATQIDIIQASPILDIGTNFKGKTFDLAFRAISLMCDQITESDLKLCDAYNKLVASGAATDKKSVQYRLFRPEPGLAPDSLDFSPTSIFDMMQRGFMDTCNRSDT
jgi:NTE family protein